MSDNLESFAEAYRLGISSTWHLCKCGIEYGEEDAHACSHSARYFRLINFEGDDYVEQCPCWRKRAQHIADWIDANKHQIADYLKIEKKRLTQFAKDHPTVERE